MKAKSYIPIFLLAIANCFPIFSSGQTISGTGHTLFVCPDGTVRSWGSDGFGALGNDAPMVNQPTAVTVTTISGITDVSAGGESSFALTNTGTVWSWGLDAYGQLGNDATLVDQPTPVSITFPNTSVSGANWSGTAVNNTGIGTAAWSTPANAAGSNAATYATVNVSNAVTSNYLMATNFGITIPAGATVLGVVATVEWFNSVNQGRDQTVRLVKAGVVQATNRGTNTTIGTTQKTSIYGNSTDLWGTTLNQADVQNAGFGVAISVNRFGGAGAFTTVSIARISIAVYYSTPSTTIIAISGGETAMALKSDGSIYAWGRNLFGQCGIGGTANQPTPVQPPISNVIAVSSSGNTLFVLKNDGTVWSIGLDNYGQLGNDIALINKNTFVQVAGLTGITAINGGGSHALALKNDGTVWAWGSDSDGQLGDNASFGFAIDDQPIPVQVVGLTGVTAVSASSRSSLALKSDGTVWVWGDNQFGQVGNGVAGPDQPTPVQIASLTGITDIAAAGLNSFAIKSDGTVWCWGSDMAGQLGDDVALADKSTPVLVSGPCTPILLPVELISFDGNCTEHKVVSLRWSTASQTNNDYFTIERSADGLSWKQLVKVDGAGNSLQAVHYQMTDESPMPEMNYYRLKQTDYNGKSEYFQTISVDNNCIDSPDQLTIFPNPANNELGFQISYKNEEDITIEVYDMLGKLIINKYSPVSAGNNLFTVDISSITNGMYMLNVKTETKSVHQKFIKQ